MYVFISFSLLHEPSHDERQSTEVQNNLWALPSQSTEGIQCVAATISCNNELKPNENLLISKAKMR